MPFLKQILNQLVQKSTKITGFSSLNSHRGYRRGSSQNFAKYQSLEPRKLLATLTVDTVSDVVDLNDGLVSLREAITATNTNAAFGDAPAGDATGDVINFASSLSGQTITLGGTELTIEDDLIVRGGNTDITLSGDDASRIFRITTAETVVLSKLDFTAGRAQIEGGALLAEGGGTVRLFQSNFSSNTAVPEIFFDPLGDGGAVYNRGSRLLISGSSFTDNNAGRSGGALYSEGGSINFSDVTFTGNDAGISGGAIATDGGDYFFFETAVEQNSTSVISAEGGGGGIYLGGVDTTAIVLASTISENSSDDGGGIFVEAENRLFIFADSSVSNNSVATGGDRTEFGNGGGIHNNGGLVRIGSSEVFNNSTVNNGGGIYSDGGTLNVSNSEIISNRARDDGGGVAVEATRLILRGTTFRSNAATGFQSLGFQFSDGGGLYIGFSESEFHRYDFG